MTAETQRSIAEIMADPQWQPTRAQVADIIARAFESGRQAGYEAGREEAIAELYQRTFNAEAMPETDAPVFSAGEWLSATRRQAARQLADQEARLPRPGDFKGVDHGTREDRNLFGERSAIRAVGGEHRGFPTDHPPGHGRRSGDGADSERLGPGGSDREGSPGPAWCRPTSA